MSDEPLFCSQCGAEDFNCDCHEDLPDGPYCEVCGVIPAPGQACCFKVKGGNRTGCVPKEEHTV